MPVVKYIVVWCIMTLVYEPLPVVTNVADELLLQPNKDCTYSKMFDNRDSAMAFYNTAIEQDIADVGSLYNKTDRIGRLCDVKIDSVITVNRNRNER